MEDDELDNIITNFNTKLGEDSSLIADDIGLLITKNSEVLNTLAEKDKKIADLEKRNQILVKANGNLLQQLPMKEEEEDEEEEEKKSNFNFRSAFDETGKFIK